MRTMKTVLACALALGWGCDGATVELPDDAGATPSEPDDAGAAPWETDGSPPGRDGGDPSPLADAGPPTCVEPDVWYRDLDLDGYGDPDASSSSCHAVEGHVRVSGDCDDGDATRHPGASELCNGIDENCDAAPDETFMCARGSTVSCVTSCGSAGMGECNSVCQPPTGSACATPAESCTYADDDCNGWRDEEQYTVSPRVTAPGLGTMRQPRAVRCGTAHVCSFWTFGSQVYGTRHDLDGNVVGPTHVPLISTTIYDVASFGTSELVFAYQDGAVIRVQYLDTATLRPIWGLAVPATSTYLRVVIDSSHVWVYTLEGSWIRRYQVSRTFGDGWDGPRNVGLSDVPFGVVAASAGFHYLSIIGLLVHDRLFLTEVTSGDVVTHSRIADAPSGVTFRDPDIAAGGGDLVVAWGEHGASPEQRNVRMLLRRGFRGGSTMRTLASGTTTRSTSLAQLMMNVEYRGGGTFLVAAIEGDGGVNGAVEAYDVQVAPSELRTSAYSIEPRAMQYQSVGLVPLEGRSDLIFFNPLAFPDIALRRLGC